MGSQNYPDEVKRIKTTQKSKNDKLPEEILSEDDIKAMIKSATNERTKALIALLWETGARIGEIVDLKPKDFRDYKHGFQIVIEGKTGSRRLPLIVSVPYIKGWFEEHPLRESDRWSDVPLWSELQAQEHGNQKKEVGQKASYDALKRDVGRTAKRAGTDKPVNPHHFRHSRATYLASRFTEAQMCEWFGWVQGSKQSSKYVHMAGRDIDSTYEKIHGIERRKEEEKAKLVPQKCSRCGKDGIEPTAKFCPKCAQSLAPKAFEEVERRKETIDAIIENLLSDSEFRKILDKKIKKAIEKSF